MTALHEPDARVRVWPDIEPDADIAVVVGFVMKPEHRATLEKAGLIIGIGAGVDGVLRNAPPHVAISRLIDDGQARTMTQYVVAAVLKYARRLDDYARQQDERVWQRRKSLAGDESRVGILGFGRLGEHVAAALRTLGFEVIGWSRSRKHIDGIECHAGESGLAPFLSRTGILVCLLPLTASTRAILDARRFAMLPRGARFINVGRGDHVVEPDLLAALDSGQLSGATLDVCIVEPLPPDHPLWTHPLVDLTPHMAGTLLIEDNVRQVMSHISKYRAGEPIPNLVDRQHGY